jgi:hypothetical protein
MSKIIWHDYTRPKKEIFNKVITNFLYIRTRVWFPNVRNTVAEKYCYYEILLLRDTGYCGILMFTKYCYKNTVRCNYETKRGCFN